jgi:hypothetical protein
MSIMSGLEGITADSLQGSWLFVTRYHQHYVQSDQKHSSFVGTLEARVYQGDWIHPYADIGGRPDISPIEWLCREALQNQHETRTV